MLIVFEGSLGQNSCSCSQAIMFKRHLYLFHSPWFDWISGSLFLCCFPLFKVLHLSIFVSWLLVEGMKLSSSEINPEISGIVNLVTELEISILELIRHRYLVSKELSSKSRIRDTFFQLILRMERAKWITNTIEERLLSTVMWNRITPLNIGRETGGANAQMTKHWLYWPH